MHRPVPSWFSRHPPSIRTWLPYTMPNRYDADPFFALWSNSRSFFSTARDLTHAEILRRTPTSPSEKLLVASSVLRTYRNRCCEAWALVCRCFDPMSLQCTDFDALTGIIASLARANIDQRGNEVGNLPWALEEKLNHRKEHQKSLSLGPCHT